MTQRLHPPFSSPSGAAICASALEEIDEETDRLFGGGCSWMKAWLQVNHF